MERIVHNAINIFKPKPTEINVSKSIPNLITEIIVIEKPRHVEVTIAKGFIGINNRNNRENTYLKKRIAALEERLEALELLLKS